MDAEAQRAGVSAYYGSTLQSSADLRTSACCPSDAVPPSHRPILAKLHPEVTERFYGCGSPIPTRLAGATLLDLGCGTGRDAFLAAALVGPAGRVIGVDMTDEQLAVARRHETYHASIFFGDASKKNTDFRHGVIEDLGAAGVEDASVDVVISNCVCNLSPDKKAVFAEVARVLKPGGEFYFSDVYADRRLSADARAHDVLVAECLGGALYLEDFRRTMASVGLQDVRVVSTAPVLVQDAELAALVPDVAFHSVTTRAFKLPELEDRREDYGQLATYTACCSDGMKLDVDFHFPKDVPVPVDANTAAILRASRFAPDFVVSEADGHRGLFKPEKQEGFLRAIQSSSGGCAPAPAAQNGEAAAVPNGSSGGGVRKCC